MALHLATANVRLRVDIFNAAASVLRTGLIREGLRDGKACTELATEDLQRMQRIESLTVRNPFLAS